MSIERRYSMRHCIDLRVHVRYRKRRLHCARARNLSTDGMYLEVQAVTLPDGTRVELEMETMGKELRIPAMVVHHKGSGIGVMFRDPQPELLEDLFALSRTHCPEAMSQALATTQAPPASGVG